MRVILDTNVFISSIFFSGPLRKSSKHGHIKSIKLCFHNKFLMNTDVLQRISHINSKRSIYCQSLNWLQFMGNSLILKVSLFPSVRTLMTTSSLNALSQENAKQLSAVINICLIFLDMKALLFGVHGISQINVCNAQSESGRGRL